KRSGQGGGPGRDRPGPPREAVASVDAQAVPVEHLGDRLEEGGPAEPAVAAATGGDPEGGAAGEQRAAAVTRLRAHGRADQPGDRALRVVDGGVERRHRAAAQAGGAAAAQDRLADERVAGVGDVPGAAVVQVHRTRPADAAVVPDDAVVVAREAADDPRADQLRVGGVGVPGRGDVGAVAGGHQVLLAAAAADVEPGRAAGVAAVDGVAAHEGQLERARRALDADRGPEPLDGRADLCELGRADAVVRLHDDLVG